MASDLHWLPGREKLESGYAELDFVLPMGLYWVRPVAEKSEVDHDPDGYPAGGHDRLGQTTYVVFREPQMRWGAPLMALTAALAKPRYRDLGRRLLQAEPAKRTLEKTRRRVMAALQVSADQENRLPLIAPIDPQTGGFLPQPRKAMQARLLPLEMLPAYIWAALDMRRPSAKRRVGQIELCYELDEFIADFIDDWLAHSIIPDLWLYDDGSRLNIDDLYRSMSPNERADVAYQLHAACEAGRRRLQTYHNAQPPPDPVQCSVTIGVMRRVCTDSQAVLQRELSPVVARMFVAYRQRVGVESATFAGFLEHLCSRIEEGRLPI